jgi:hypothetical protein
MYIYGADAVDPLSHLESNESWCVSGRFVLRYLYHVIFHVDCSVPPFLDRSLFMSLSGVLSVFTALAVRPFIRVASNKCIPKKKKRKSLYHVIVDFEMSESCVNDHYYPTFLPWYRPKNSTYTDSHLFICEPCGNKTPPGPNW